MAQTMQRSSTQLYIDDNLNFHAKKGINLSPGLVSGDAVEYSQMLTAIANAVIGAGNAIHEPVADLAGAKAVPAADIYVGGVISVKMPSARTIRKML